MEEKRRVTELTTMLEQQEARNKSKQPKPKEMDPRIVAGLTSAKAKAAEGRECYKEENLMNALQATNARKELQSREKKDKVQQLRLETRDFIKGQINEHKDKAQLAVESKLCQKSAAETMASEYHEAELQKIGARRMRNVQYRIDLETQMAVKQRKPQGHNLADGMSQAEVAMNRRLLLEAQDP